jgi:mRNA interferase RelE/StbE
MKKYTVEVSRSAEKDIDNLPSFIVDKVWKVLESLEINPFPIGCKKLKGKGDSWRVRVGDYRIVYLLVNERVIIKIIAVKHRKDIYRQF